MKVLIDTCVLVDFLQKRAPFDSDARDVMMLVASNFVDGFTTAKAVTDIYYLTHRTTHSNEQTKKVLGGLLSIIGVMNTQGVDIQQALISSVSDFEDAVMIATAKCEGADCIVTRNMKDYEKAELPVYTPADFVQMIRQSLE